MIWATRLFFTLMLAPAASVSGVPVGAALAVGLCLDLIAWVCIARERAACGPLPPPSYAGQGFLWGLVGVLSVGVSAMHLLIWLLMRGGMPVFSWPDTVAQPLIAYVVRRYGELGRPEDGLRLAMHFGANFLVALAATVVVAARTPATLREVATLRPGGQSAGGGF